MQCNACWTVLQSDIYIASCSHVFCENDARKIFSGTRACPVCDTSLAGRGSIRGNEVVADDTKAIALCGLAPKDILAVAQKAIRFHEFQQWLATEHEKKILSARVAEKAQAAHEAGEQLLAAVNEVNSAKHENRHLRDKLAEAEEQIKSHVIVKEELERQKRKLEDLYEAERAKAQDESCTHVRNVFEARPGSETSLFQASGTAVVALPQRRYYASDSELNVRPLSRQRTIGAGESGVPTSHPILVPASGGAVRHVTPEESPFRLRVSPVLSNDRFARLHADAAKPNSANSLSNDRRASTASLLRRPETPAFARFRRK